MPYQSVNSCRFYVDTPSFLKQTGVHIPSGLNISDEDIHGFYGLNPTNPLGSGDADHQLGYQSRMIPVSNDGKNNYIAVLGHSGLENIWLNTTSISGSTNDVVSGIVDIEEIINFTLPIQFNGFSMATFTNATPDDIYYHLYPVCQSSNEIFIGSLSVGTFYDMPHSPNLNLTMSREYGGIKTIETKVGASLSNAFYIKPPMWGDLPPWELSAISGSDEAAHTIPDRGDAKLGASGRRIWDLSFSYLDDGDVFGSNQSIGWQSAYYYEGVGDQPHIVSGFPDSLDSDDYEWDGDTWSAYTHNLLTDDNFFSQVWHKTLGGTLPFIFQPDKNNSSPAQFAICKFKNNSLKATRSAFNVYDISLSIEEVW